MKIWNELFQVEASYPLVLCVRYDLNPKEPKLRVHLDERPTLRLPPTNIVGMIEVVPDVDHLENVSRLVAFQYGAKL